MSYTNADGLYVLMHGDQGEVIDNGTTSRSARKEFVLDLTGTAIPSSAATPNAQDAFIPAGSYITNAYLIVDEAFTSGGSATLTVGTYNAAGTAVDADGIDATVALGVIDAVGDVVVCNGAQVGGTSTVGSADVYVEAIYGTAAFTAGSAKLVIEYL